VDNRTIPAQFILDSEIGELFSIILGRRSEAKIQWAKSSKKQSVGAYF